MLFTTPAGKLLATIEKNPTPITLDHVDVIMRILGHENNKRLEKGKKISFNLFNLAKEHEVRKLCDILEASGVQVDDPEKPEFLTHGNMAQFVTGAATKEEFTRRLNQLLAGEMTTKRIWALYDIACHYRANFGKKLLYIVGAIIVVGVATVLVLRWLNGRSNGDDGIVDGDDDMILMEDETPIVSSDDEIVVVGESEAS